MLEGCGIEVGLMQVLRRLDEVGPQPCDGFS
jgi:hypothetical protein